MNLSQDLQQFAGRNMYFSLFAPLTYMPYPKGYKRWKNPFYFWNVRYFASQRRNEARLLHLTESRYIFKEYFGNSLFLTFFSIPQVPISVLHENNRGL